MEHVLFFCKHAELIWTAHLFSGMGILAMEEQAQGGSVEERGEDSNLSATLTNE